MYCENYITCKEKYTLKDKFKSFRDYSNEKGIIEEHCADIIEDTIYNDEKVYCLIFRKYFKKTITDFQVMVYENINKK